LGTVLNTNIQCNEQRSQLRKHYTTLTASNMFLRIVIFHAQLNEYLVSENM